MARTARAAISLVLLVGGLTLAPAGAMADGLPIPGVTAKPGGVATPDGRIHYETGTRDGKTTVVKIDWRTGKTLASTTVSGDYTVPAVALDGTPGGLSADGSWLTLIKPRVKFPQSTTHLITFTTASLRVRDRLNLRGDYSFDAISPTGARIYLIQYLSPRNPTHYAVRAYDTTSGRMLPKPVVDPTEPDEQMRGYPITRVASPDGRWQYTLYSGSKKPFIHALDTAGATARCIDLPRSVGSAGVDGLRISPDGASLSVTNRNKGGSLATVDTSTFAVSEPGARPAAADGGSDGAFPWLLIALSAALAVAVAAWWGMPRIRRRRLAGSG